ncbi:MAG TPA: SDR family oxidoreductase [Gallionellaceae bacterium]
MKRILVTGANGFVGHALCAELLRRNFRVTAAVRQSSKSDVRGDRDFVSAAVGQISGDTDWGQCLHGVDVVIHLAARVHVMRETEAEPLTAFRQVNVQGTARLAQAAAAAGVRRLVYVSSIKVNGEETVGERRYDEYDVPAPQDPYGISKWEAEQALHRVAQETGLEMVIVRPPLVYGPGVKGNFAQMLRAVARGWPLPLASVVNQRDLLYLGNLVDALILCASHPAAAGQTYLLSDGEPVSTQELLRELASALQVPARLFPCPAALLRLLAGLSGKSAQLQRLLGSLQLDAGKIRADLGWKPPYTLQQGLRATAEHYRSHT